MEKLAQQPKKYNRFEPIRSRTRNQSTDTEISDDDTTHSVFYNESPIQQRPQKKVLYDSSLPNTP